MVISSNLAKTCVSLLRLFCGLKRLALPYSQMTKPFTNQKRLHIRTRTAFRSNLVPHSTKSRIQAQKSEVTFPRQAMVRQTRAPILSINDLFLHCMPPFVFQQMKLGLFRMISFFDVPPKFSGFSPEHPMSQETSHFLAN